MLVRSDCQRLLAMRGDQRHRFEATIDCVQGRALAIMNSELGIDRPNVPTNCVPGYKERRCNFPILVALRQQSQYLLLAVSEFTGVVGGKIIATNLREEQSRRPEFPGYDRLNSPTELPRWRFRIKKSHATHL